MDNTNSATPQPADSPDASTQAISSISPAQQPTPQPVVSSTMVLQTPQQPRKSGLKKIIIILVSTVAAVILIGTIGFFVLITSVFHALNGQCGVNSNTHKQEVPKVAVFNTVSVIPGQPNEPASIYDSSAGTCNIDVTQSYSATKSYTVSMDGATALSTVTESLKRQGFALSKQVFSNGDVAGQTSCSTSIWGWANYTGKSTTITVVFGSPTQQCQDPPGTYLVGALPTVTQAQFANTSITSIKATVSTPDEIL
jgi:hypothetical protein